MTLLQNRHLAIDAKLIRVKEFHLTLFELMKLLETRQAELYLNLTLFNRHLTLLDTVFPKAFASIRNRVALRRKYPSNIARTKLV